MKHLQQLPDISTSFQKMKLQDKLSTPRGIKDGNFAFIVANAAMDRQLKVAAMMVRDQYNLGHQEEIEWMFGASTINLINELYPC